MNNNCINLYLIIKNSNRGIDFIKSSNLSNTNTYSDLITAISKYLPEYNIRDNFTSEKRKVISDKELALGLFPLFKDKRICNTDLIVEYNNTLKSLNINAVFDDPDELIPIHDKYLIKELNKTKIKNEISTYVKRGKISYSQFGEKRFQILLFYDNNDLFNSNISTENYKNMSKSEFKIYNVIKDSSIPLSRSDILYQLDISDRTFAYSINKLISRQLVKRVNETKGFKSYSYTLSRNKF